MTLRGKHIVLADFDATMMEYCIDEATFDYEYGKKDPEIKKTDKFSPRKWIAWQYMVYTYFTIMKKFEEYPSHMSYERPHTHQVL